MILTPLKDTYPRYPKRYSTATYLNYFSHYKPMNKRGHIFLQTFKEKKFFYPSLKLGKNTSKRRGLFSQKIYCYFFDHKNVFKLFSIFFFFGGGGKTHQ